MSLLTIIGGIVLCAIIGLGIIYLIDNVEINGEDE
jgi:hypothetical protein